MKHKQEFCVPLKFLEQNLHHIGTVPASVKAMFSSQMCEVKDLRSAYALSSLKVSIAIKLTLYNFFCHLDLASTQTGWA